jgi:hypothetical protein
LRQGSAPARVTTGKIFTAVAMSTTIAVAAANNMPTANSRMIASVANTLAASIRAIAIAANMLVANIKATATVTKALVANAKAIATDGDTKYLAADRASRAW